MSYEMCPLCGNKALAKLETPISGVYYICDECAAELDEDKREIKYGDE